MNDEIGSEAPSQRGPEPVLELPPGVLVARVGAGANCSSAGSAIDILFYTSVIAGAIAVALSAAFPPEAQANAGDGSHGDGDGSSGADPEGTGSGSK